MSKQVTEPEVETDGLMNALKVIKQEKVLIISDENFRPLLILSLF